MEVVFLKVISTVAKLYSLVALPFLKVINSKLFGEVETIGIEEDSDALILGHISTLLTALHFSQSQVNDLVFSLIQAFFVGLTATLTPIIARHIYKKYIKKWL